MSPSLYQYIVDGYRKALEYDRVSNNLRMLLGSDAVELAAEMARTTYLDQFQAIDAVKDCWAYDGRDLEKTRETIVRSDKAGISVRAVLQLQRHPTLIKYAPYVEGETPTPSAFRPLGLPVVVDPNLPPYTVDFYQVNPPRMPEPGDVVHACTSDGTVLGSFVWPEPGEPVASLFGEIQPNDDAVPVTLWPDADQPSTLREDLDAIRDMDLSPYQPLIRYRHPADAPKSHGN